MLESFGEIVFKDCLSDDHSSSLKPLSRTVGSMAAVAVIMQMEITDVRAKVRKLANFTMKSREGKRKKASGKRGWGKISSRFI